MLYKKSQGLLALLRFLNIHQNLKTDFLALNMGDALEVLGYIFGFWRFVFSQKFRKEYISVFNDMSLFKKIIASLNAITCSLIGLSLPIIIIVTIYGYLFIESEIDTCLDTGGSYNYQLCECDHSMSHPYQKEHKCH